MAAEARTHPGAGARRALRHGRSRSASTTSTRSRAGTSRSSATRRSSTHATSSVSRTRSTRPTTSCDTTPGAKVFLGLREDADLEAFRAAAEEAERTGGPVRPGAIPPGASGRAAPSLPDPGRHTARERRGQCRARDQRDSVPVHAPVLRLAATESRRASCDPSISLMRSRTSTGPVAATRCRRDLVQEPVVKLQARDSPSSDLGELDELFFAVDRLDFDDEIAVETQGTFPRAEPRRRARRSTVETVRGDSHVLAYAETLVIPASIAGYRLERRRGPACKVVKALVRVTRGSSRARRRGHARVCRHRRRRLGGRRLDEPRAHGARLRLAAARSCSTASATRRAPRCRGDVDAAGVAVPGPFDYARGICLLEHKLESLYGDRPARRAGRRALAGARERPVPERRRGVPAR